MADKKEEKITKEKKTIEDKTVNRETQAKKDIKKDEGTKKDAKDVFRFDNIVPGMTVRVHQKIREINPKGQEKERVQVFEGIVLARKGGRSKSATITVYKNSFGVGVEKIFPLHLPTIVKIQPIKQARVRRAKLYYLKGRYKKKLKEKRL